MKLSEKVAELEKRVPRKNLKLPDHNRMVYFVCVLPKKSNKLNEFSLNSNIYHIIQRYAKIYGMKSTYSLKAFGRKGTKQHYLKMVTKVYFKK